MLKYIIALDHKISNLFISSQTAKTRNINQNSLTIKFFKAITFLGTSFFWFPIIFILFFINNYTKIAVITVLCELFNYLILIPIRLLVKRPRPEVLKSPKIYDWWNKYSFPSAHAARCGYLFNCCYYFFESYIYFFTIIILLIIFSRLILKKHYFSDLLLGFLIGLISSYILITNKLLIFS